MKQHTHLELRSHSDHECCRHLRLTKAWRSAPALLTVLTVLSCHAEELAAARADLATVEQRLAAATTELREMTAKAISLDKERGEAKLALALAQNELEGLKQTPQYVYQQAINAAAPNTDVTDKSAILALQSFVDRYPTDTLRAPAEKKIVDLNRRIEERAERLRKAQSRARELLTTCVSLTKRAATTANAGLRFNYFGDLDMNAAMDASRESDRTRERAKLAKENGLELVDATIDPTGELKRRLETCDQL